jgi:anti-sigma regulatory factor (Ser/Thr protein kinase)
LSEVLVYDGPEDLGAVRAFARSRALALGLPTLRAEQLALAVSELATNTLQHTTDGGEVRVWSEPGRLMCEVVDGGHERPFGAMPSPDSQRGRGLAIVREVCDDVATTSGPTGTSVRLRMNLPSVTPQRAP